MRFIVEHPLSQHGCRPDLYDHRGIAELARTAEAAGYDAISFTEHPAPPRTWVDAGGHASLDPLAALSFCAAVTERLRLLSYLVVAPFRPALGFAKAVASVDRLSGGRFIVGTGMGYLKDEFEAMGVDFGKRAARLDDALDVLRHVWSHSDFSHSSPFLHADHIVSTPGPVQLPHPPIWLGGNSSAALRRVARSGDGWMALVMEGNQSSTPLSTPEDVGGAVRKLRDEIIARDRDPGTVAVSAFTPHSTIYSDEGFSTEQHLDHLGRLRDVGVTWFVIRPPRHGLRQACDALARYQREIVPQSK